MRWLSSICLASIAALAALPGCTGEGAEGSGEGAEGSGEDGSGSGGDTGNPALCGPPGHSVSLEVDGVDYPIPAATSAPDTMTATATSLGGSHHTEVPGFEIGEERQVILNFSDLSVATLDAGDGHGSVLYREFPAANEPRAADVEILGPVAGTVTVFVIPAQVGDRLCGEYELTVSAERELRISGHFNHGFDDTVMTAPG